MPHESARAVPSMRSGAQSRGGLENSRHEAGPTFLFKSRSLDHHWLLRTYSTTPCGPTRPGRGVP